MHCLKITRQGFSPNASSLRCTACRRVLLLIVSRCRYSALLLIFGAVILQPARANAQTDEYRVKAAFLFHFAQLVDWPAGAPGDDKKLFNVCTLGEDPFHGDLDSAIDGKSIGLRTMRVHHLMQAEQVRACQIVFIGKNENKRIPALLAELDNAPVMTVGETDNFVRQGGIIGFCLDNDKVRFEINLVAAEHARLKISSRLLLLAKNVINNQPER